MKHQLIGVSLGMFGASLLFPSANAQNRSATPFPPFTSAGTSFSAPLTKGFQQFPFRPTLGRARFHGRSARVPRRHYFVYPYAAYSPYFYYPDYDYDNGPAEQAPPPPSRSTPQPATPAVTPRAADSVVMELRGDHWVRLTVTGPVEAMAPAASAVRAALLPAFDQSPPAQPLPAAILVFRDGHQEEAARYTIIGNAIYLKADYYLTGSWTRKVPIAELDISATLKLNSERGTGFTLPSRPSEVILRP